MKKNIIKLKRELVEKLREEMLNRRSRIAIKILIVYSVVLIGFGIMLFLVSGKQKSTDVIVRAIHESQVAYEEKQKEMDTLSDSEVAADSAVADSHTSNISDSVLTLDEFFKQRRDDLKNRLFGSIGVGDGSSTGAGESTN